MSLTLVLPFPATETRRAAPAAAPLAGVAPRRGPLPAKPVLGLIDNGKIKADVLLGALGAQLKQSGAIGDYFVHRKSAMVPITNGERDAIVARADIVISGLGDCGGCTACSTTDALLCLAQGVPAFMLASERFAFLVDATDREYGLAGLSRLYVEHPVWTREGAWFDAAATKLATTVANVLGLAAAAPTVSPAAIATALEDLRHGLDADGYDMEIGVDGSSIRIDVVARAGAGERCLIPRNDIAKAAGDLLRQAGIEAPQDRISVRMGSPAA